jgi:hypothetical protein
MRFTAPVQGDFGYPSGVVMGENLLIVHYSAGPASTAYDGSKARCIASLVPIEAILETAD